MKKIDKWHTLDIQKRKPNSEYMKNYMRDRRAKNPEENNRNYILSYWTREKIRSKRERLNNIEKILDDNLQKEFNKKDL